VYMPELTSLLIFFFPYTMLFCMRPVISYFISYILNFTCYI
jgi:hypothetical protein